MKKFTLSLTVLILTLALWAGSAFAYTINDEYVGADDHGMGDVIGNPGLFDISKAEISLSGSMLRIDIYTNFAGLGDDGLFANYTSGGNGIGYGDLFLSDSWDPFGTSPYVGDDNSTGTLWTYGFALDNRIGQS